MRVLFSVAALSIFIATGAWAQNAGTAPAKSAPSATAPKAGVVSAPVGHRQPTPAEVGKSEDGLTPSAEDKELDRKIKSICRGC